MAERRPDQEGYARVKRQKTEDMDGDGGVSLYGYMDQGNIKTEKKGTPTPKKNPYTDHMDNEAGLKMKDEDKSQKKGKGKGLDPRANPYLAHQYEEPAEESHNSYSAGYGKAAGRANGISNGSSVVNFPRHKTDAAMAKKAEDGPNNPFSGQPLSNQYFNILKTRRNLPVHAQRNEFLQMYQKSQILVFVGETGSGKTTQIPQFVLFDDQPHNQRKQVACTQPRRVVCNPIVAHF